MLHLQVDHSLIDKQASLQSTIKLTNYEIGLGAPQEEDSPIRNNSKKGTPRKFKIKDIERLGSKPKLGT